MMTEDKKPYAIFIMGSALFLVSFLVYSNTLINDFVFDDTMNILENPLIRSFANLPEIFSSDVWSHLGQSGVSKYYKPLFNTTNMLGYHLYGFNAAGYHLTSSLLHSATTLMLFFLIMELPITAVNRLSTAFFASFLFAVTPIHTEAVAWVSGVSEPAFSFFYLLAFYFHIRSRHALSAIAFLVSSLYKESALTLPVILLLYDISFISPMGKEASRITRFIKNYLPLGIAIGIYFALRINAVGLIPEFKRSALGLSGGQYLMNVFPLFTKYLWKLLLPMNLNFLYPFEPVYSLLGSGVWMHVSATVIYAGLSVLFWKSDRIVFFLMWFIPLSMLPVFYIPAFGEYAFAERYLYLPSAAFCILSAIFIARFFEKKSLIIVMIISSLFAMVAMNRNHAWKDDVVFWQDAVAKSPDNYVAHSELAYGYMEQGMADKAVEHYKQSIALNINNVTAYINLGKIYISRGMYDSAIEIFRNASMLKPDSAEIYYNIGLCYRLKGMETTAQEYFDKSVSLKPLLFER